MSATEQRTPTVQVVLSKFDSAHTSEPIFRLMRDAHPISEFRPLSMADYIPRGATPLRDATGAFIAHLDTVRSPDSVTIGVLMDESGSMGGNQQSVINGVNEFVAGMADVSSVDPKVAGTVLAVVVTDGHENASRELTPEKLAEVIASHEADGYTFIFLGANIDAWGAGAQMGFSGSASGQTVAYASTPVGTTSALNAVSLDAASYLSDNQAYVKSRAGSSRRSVTETGEESLENLSPGVQLPDTPQTAPKDVLGVSDALSKARGVTGK